MGKITLAQYRTSVRSKLDDSSYEQTVVDESINWYVAYILLKVRARVMEDSDELNISLGDTSVDFPNDMQAVLNLVVTSPTPARRIFKNYVSYEDFSEQNPGFTTVAARPVVNSNWTDFGNAMRLSAPAIADTVILCDYLRRPKLMEENDATCDISDAYAQMITIGSLAEVMERNEDYEEAAAERRKLTGDASRPGLETLFAKNEGRGFIKTGPVIINANRGMRRGGYRVDRDGL